MRTQLDLDSNWWVSVSAADARLAATETNWKAEQLEQADDPENHPKEIDLPGGWQVGLRPPAEPTGAATDETLAADATFVGGGSQATPQKRLPAHFLNYARKVRIPQDWAGHSVFLCLDNARYHVTAQVNGTQVAQYVGGLEPHRIDVTAAVRPGADNEILITVGDVGVSGHKPFDPHNFTGTRLPTCKEIENNLVHPVHYGGFDGRGIGEARLEVAPKVRVEHVFANPKVSQGLLQFTVAMANDTDAEATVRMHSLAVPVAGQNLPETVLLANGTWANPDANAQQTLVDENVTIPAHGRQTVARDIPWTDAVLWDTDQPHLYQLCTTLTALGAEARGQAPITDHRSPITDHCLDTHTDTFGFREFTINGHDFMLNGRKIHLLGQSGHVGPKQHAMSLEEKIEFLRIAKDEGHINHVRLHAKPMAKNWVEAADRAGMLITTETALWTTGFHSFDWAGSEEACYENVRNHFLEALVRRDRNNPSVIMWSLSNEMSPITKWDLTEGANAPKMSAMTRIFKRILDEVAVEDDSRVTQMSSAMDFIGNLAMYNLHYPKNWQAYPDYPHTAYWLDGAFKFRWFGHGYGHVPAWSWRQDKPLYFGEYTCVHGATPDNQASIVGDVAFEQADFGSVKVQEKLWWMEAQAYRRRDVSGFCAWAFLLVDDTDCRKLLARPDAAAYVRAIRPLAVLDHNYRHDYLSRAEVVFPLSIHNDTRHELELALVCEALHNGAVIHTETMPSRRFAPGASMAFTNRFLAPETECRAEVVYRATLTRADGQVVDQWERNLTVQPRQIDLELPADFGLFDPDDLLGDRLQARGIRGGRRLRKLNEAALNGLNALWLGFPTAHANTGDWRRIRRALQNFVNQGGCVILDQAPATVLGDLPVPIRNGKGYAHGDRLEITYAYPCAPFHPVMAGLAEADFRLWGEDHYVANRCVEIPQEGNAIPLLVAGTDRAGLVNSPLLELRYGQGSYLISTLEILPKLNDAPVAARLLGTLAGYRPAWGTKTAAVCLGAESWQRLLEVGFSGDNESVGNALKAEVAVLEGETLSPADFARIGDALAAGRTVCVHALDEAQTTALLEALALPGTVVGGEAKPAEWDVCRHRHPLANGMTNNYLYWIVDKSKIAPWTLAPTHPRPASALVELPAEADNAASLTRRGAVTVYTVGDGTLVVDNLRWQLSDFDEPERPRRYVRCLLTNLGVPLLKGVEKRMSEEFETEAERRERGHF